MQLIASDAKIMCCHGGEVDTAAAESKAFKSDGNPLIVSEKVAGLPISGCKNPVTPAGTKPCSATTSMIVGKCPIGFKADGETYCFPFLICMTDSVPPGVTMIANPGQSGFKIKPSFALPLVQAAAEAIEKSPLSEEDKKNALAQVKKQAEEESKAAEEEEDEEKERKPKVQVRIEQISRLNEVRANMGYLINDPDNQLTSLKIEFKNEKTEKNQVFDNLPTRQGIPFLGQWNICLKEVGAKGEDTPLDTAILTKPDAEITFVEEFIYE